MCVQWKVLNSTEILLLGNIVTKSNYILFPKAINHINKALNNLYKCINIQNSKNIKEKLFGT